jgi:hypothetical protein
MTWVTHSKWLERHFDGTQALDLDAVLAGSTIKLGIVTESVINADTNNLYTGLTAVATGTGWTGPVTLANITCGLNGSFNLVFDADDPSVIAQDVGTGFANARSLVIYEDLNKYILAHHTEGATFGNTTGPITTTLDAAGIIEFTI